MYKVPLSTLILPDFCQKMTGKENKNDKEYQPGCGILESISSPADLLLAPHFPAADMFTQQGNRSGPRAT